MADGHGGARRPANPAPASGPGKLSKRTDGGPGQKVMAPTGMAYGDHQAMTDQEKSAALSQTNTVKPANVPAAQQLAPAGGPPQMPPLDAPSNRPNEPVTSGVPIGPGPGPSPMMQAAPDPGAGSGTMTALLQRLSPTDATGILGQLMQAAQARNA